MRKSYWLAPLVALLIFGGIFVHFKSGYEAREKAKQAQILAEKQVKLQAEVEARRKAVEDAVRVQAERKKEREAKEAAEQARKDARQLALDARDKAFREQEKLGRQIENLKKDITAEQEAIAKATQDRTYALADQAFLKTYIERAKANLKALDDVLTKIDVAEQARLAAAAAEANAKKNS